MSGIYQAKASYNKHYETIPGTYEHYYVTFSSIYRARLTRAEWTEKMDRTKQINLAIRVLEHELGWF